MGRRTTRSLAAWGLLVAFGLAGCAPQPAVVGSRPAPPVAVAATAAASAAPAAPLTVATPPPDEVTPLAIEPAYVVVPLGSTRVCAELRYWPKQRKRLALRLPDTPDGRIVVVNLHHRRPRLERFEVISVDTWSVTSGAASRSCRSAIEVQDGRMVVEGADLFPTKEECEAAQLTAAPLQDTPPSLEGGGPRGPRVAGVPLISTYTGGPCWPEAVALMRRRLEEPAVPLLTREEAAFLAFVRRGLTIYKPDDCKPWQVRPRDLHFGIIERQELTPNGLLTREVSYLFEKAVYSLYIEYQSEAEVLLTRTDRWYSSSPALGTHYIDVEVSDPVGGMYGWYPTIKSCERAVAAAADQAAPTDSPPPP